MTFAVFLTVVSILCELCPSISLRMTLSNIEEVRVVRFSNQASVVENDYRGSATQRCSLLKERELSLRIELIDKAAHLVIWETADKFNEAVLRFLKS